MNYSILPPELLILLASIAEIKRYKDESDSQISYACYASQNYPGTKQYYFPVKIKI